MDSSHSSNSSKNIAEISTAQPLISIGTKKIIVLADELVQKIDVSASFQQSISADGSILLKPVKQQRQVVEGLEVGSFHNQNNHSLGQSPGDETAYYEFYPIYAFAYL